MKKSIGGGFLILFVLIVVAKIYNPEIFKIIWYQKPQVDTYKQFPVREMNASQTPFQFAERSVTNYNLDTLSVKNWEAKDVPFSEYFEKGDMIAFLVIKNDTIVYEKYKDGFARTSIVNTFSIGKSMISILIGKAIELGFIKNSKQKVIEFIPELEQVSQLKSATIEDLLNMKSGLQFKRAGDGLFSDLFCDEARFFYTSDLKKNLLKIKSNNPPGTNWKYSNLDPLILTWLIERATKMKVSTFFEQEIWQPIGAIHKGSWGVDKENGLENSPSSFQCTAIDLAKIGRLFLKKGRRGASQIIPQNWIEQSTIIKQENQSNTSKGLQKSTHQYYWWLPQNGFIGDFSAEGLRGQRLYVNPEKEVIIVQFANRGYGGYPYRKISNYFYK